MILAAVAISSIQNDGILGYAQNASTLWNQAQKEEQNLLGNYEAYLQEHLPTTGNDNTPTTITFTIDGIQYTTTSGTTWGTWMQGYAEWSRTYLDYVGTDYNEELGVYGKVISYNNNYVSAFEQIVANRAYITVEFGDS